MTDETEHQPDVVVDDAIVQDAVADDAIQDDATDDTATVETTADAPEDTAPELLQFTQEQFDGIIKSRVGQAERSAQRKFEQQAQEKQQEPRPVVPELPDPYSVSEDEYEKAVKTRDEAFRAQVVYDSKIEDQKRQETQRANETYQAKQQEYVTRADSFVAKAEALKLDPVRAVQSLNQTCGNETSNAIFDVVSHLDDGPAVLEHLSKNPAEALKIASMPPTQRGIYVATHVVSKATQPPRTKTPAPITTENGGGYAGSKSPFLKGGKILY